jgi:hypothetical protein
MACVRGNASYWPLLAVERECVEADVVHPKTVLDEIALVGCSRSKTLRPVILSHPFEKLRHRVARGEQISLKLDGRDWKTREAPILIDDGVTRILPALVVVTLWAPGGIFEEPVAVAVADLVAPRERASRSLEMLLQERVLTRPPPRVPQREAVERGRVVRPEVRRVRDRPPVCELTSPKLVRQLAPAPRRVDRRVRPPSARPRPGVLLQ